MDNLSYDKLLENEEFINNTRSVLYDSFGEDHILSTDKEVVDAFYENFREVDTNVVDAYQLWSATNGDLDDYHGHIHDTPEFPEGIYHYHITDELPWINGDGFYGTPGNITR